MTFMNVKKNVEMMNVSQKSISVCKQIRFLCKAKLKQTTSRVWVICNTDDCSSNRVTYCYEQHVTVNVALKPSREEFI